MIFTHLSNIKMYANINHVLLSRDIDAFSLYSFDLFSSLLKKK